tara:strand:- start:21812 stop:22009 length:198 start_codon:yes stop_codon:yes gene_type:complete
MQKQHTMKDGVKLTNNNDGTVTRSGLFTYQLAGTIVDVFVSAHNSNQRENAWQIMTDRKRANRNK